ncbi:MAG TPA: hypothetical protein VFM83_10320 [Gaiellaceae bacterium]|nr:hypothetical protein [Gaiellaceae bacterium]
MLRIVSTASAVAAMLVFGITSVGAMGAASSRTLHGSAPAWAKQGNLIGAADPAGTVGFRVYLG